MCGVAGVAGIPDAAARIQTMIGRLHHRGPDAKDAYVAPSRTLALGHTRLSILDLSAAGNQPMTSADGRFVIAFNGEVYNHVELRRDLDGYPFRSHTDTEVVLAAWSRWGSACLPHLNGMFAFLVWDTLERTLFAVRDRFGVKPLLFARLPNNGVAIASEFKALHAGGVPRAVDDVAWATYLTSGISDQVARTFWAGIERVPAGCFLRWSADRPIELRRWYDFAARVAELDDRSLEVVTEDYIGLLRDSVALRFRADVPVGINLSGGIDSSTLLALVDAVRGSDNAVKVFSFMTGDERYDELPWIEAMLQRTNHPLLVSQLTPEAVPELADAVAASVEEPYGGIPTLAYATLFRRAREEGVIVLLDGQGMDEQWAGYDYYRDPPASQPFARVQGSSDRAVRPECLQPELAARADTFEPPTPFPDRLRNLQYVDIEHVKLPRALRFNDYISMAASTELREPFLDYRLVELAMRQPAERKIKDGTGKWLLREMIATLTPAKLRLAPKRPVQTPQREWLRGPLRQWAGERIELTLEQRPEWFDEDAVRDAWQDFVSGRGDNSFWVWQWLSIPWATGGSS